MPSPISPLLAADLADLILVFAQWAIDPARPINPVDRGSPGLFERLNGEHKETLPVIGTVALPEFQSLLGGDGLPALPTLIKRAAVALGMIDTLPAYNTINAAMQTLIDSPRAPLTKSQSVMLEPLQHLGAVEHLRAAIVQAEPASAFGFAHIVSGWLHSARFEHPDSYLLNVQRQLVIDDGCLVRGNSIEGTAHAHRLLQPDDPWVSAIGDPVVCRMLRQLDTTLYLLAAQQAEWGRAFVTSGFDDDLFDSMYRAPYSPRELRNRFFEVLRGYAGLSTWDALSMNGDRRVCGKNSTSHEQLNKWRRGPTRMSANSLKKLIEHSPGFGRACREDELAIFHEGYRMMLSAVGAASRLDDAVADLDPDPRSVLFDRCATYLGHHRADLDTWVSRSAF